MLFSDSKAIGLERLAPVAGLFCVQVAQRAVHRKRALPVPPILSTGDHDHLNRQFYSDLVGKLCCYCCTDANDTCITPLFPVPVFKAVIQVRYRPMTQTQKTNLPVKILGDWRRGKEFPPSAYAQPSTRLDAVLQLGLGGLAGPHFRSERPPIPPRPPSFLRLRLRNRLRSHSVAASPDDQPHFPRAFATQKTRSRNGVGRPAVPDRRWTSGTSNHALGLALTHPCWGRDGPCCSASCSG